MFPQWLISRYQHCVLKCGFRRFTIAYYQYSICAMQNHQSQLHWSNEGQDHDGKNQRQLTCSSGHSQTLDWQLGNLHGTKLGPMNVGDSCVAVRPGLIPGTWTGFLEPISYGGMPYSALMHGGGAQSCSNLVCQPVLTTQGRPYPLWGVNGVGMGCVGGMGEGKGEGGTVVGM